MRNVQILIVLLVFIMPVFGEWTFFSNRVEHHNPLNFSRPNDWGERDIVLPERGEFILIPRYGEIEELNDLDIDQEELSVIQQFRDISSQEIPDVFMGERIKVILIQLTPPNESRHRHVESFSFSIQGDFYPTRPWIEGYYFDKSSITERVIPEIPAWAKLKQLKYLELFSWSISALSWHKISTLGELHYLGVPYDCSDQDLAVLAPLVHLTFLNLYDTEVTGEGLSVIQKMPALETLDLGRNSLKPGFAIQFKSSGLKRLLLDRCHVTNAHLIGIETLKNLEVLSLDQTKVTSTILDCLARMKSLKYVSLAGTVITQADIKELQAQRPDLQVNLNSPPYLKEAIKNATYQAAHLGDFKAQLELWYEFNMANLYKMDYSDPSLIAYEHSTQDNIELLKWYYCILENDRCDQESLARSLKRAEERDYTINDIKKTMNPVEISEARKRADFVMDLSQLNLSVEQMLRQAADPYLPLYQYSFKEFGAESK